MIHTPFDPSWLVHEDADLLVANKPAFVSSQSANEGDDDLASRLGAWLSAREGHPAYVGSHQRLDAMTSGLMVYARRKSANASLAKSFEGRQVVKTYVALVSGQFRGERRLKHSLVDVRGKMQVARNGHPGLNAEAVVRSVKVVGQRALVELDLLTGRMHQARVQLAALGHPIVGDPLYGGEAAPRLFLHAKMLSFTHPSSGQQAKFHAPLPKEFDAWLRGQAWGAEVYDDTGSLMQALRWAVEKRYALLSDRQNTACRIVNEDGDGLPKLAVDRYGSFAVAQFYEDPIWSADAGRKGRVLDALQRIGFEGVYEKTRPKQANTVVDTRSDFWAPKEPSRGKAAPSPMVVTEHGVPFFAMLDDGLSTGVFLDQRANRAWFAKECGGARVLNLFAYHGAFSVAAASGGAASITSVDVSLVALGHAKEGVQALRFEGEHHCVADDVFAWLARAAKRAHEFDVIVCDPPSYSTVRGKRWVASDHYAELAASVFAIAAPNARILFCTNHRKTGLPKFRALVDDGASLAGVALASMRDAKPPHDYPVAIGDYPHLKSVKVVVSGCRESSKGGAAR